MLGDRKKKALIADDEEQILQVLSGCMRSLGFEVRTAGDGAEALALLNDSYVPDLVLTDVHMPQIGGLELCRRIRAIPELHDLPIIMVTAAATDQEIAQGFEAGADDYITKPAKLLELTARVRSMMRISDAQKSLKQANEQLSDLNRNLEQKVREQVAELERVNRLRQFFSPQIVNTIISDSGHDMLREHSGEVTVVFLDLCRFSSFAEQHPPGVVIDVIRHFQRVVGPIIFDCRGTLERFTGDGLMVFLGDPEPMPDHPLQAVRMCLKIREATEALFREWQDRGYDLALSMGAATGVASLGIIGFDERLDYAAIGVVTNLAARICSKAADGQILIAEETWQRVDGLFATVAAGSHQLKGFSQRQNLFEVLNSLQAGC